MGHSISAVLGEAWLRFQQQVLWMVPHVLASLLVLGIGVILGVAVRRVGNRLLAASKVDRRLSHLGIGPTLERLGIHSSVRVIAWLLEWSIIFVAANLALYSLDARLASDLVGRLLLYVPHLLVAIVILGVGVMAARFLGRSVLIAAVNGEIPGARLLSGATRVVVMLLALAIACEHLGIGRVTLATAFAILFGGATLAAAIALGFGLQDVVRRWVAVQMVDPARRQDEKEPIQHW